MIRTAITLSLFFAASGCAARHASAPAPPSPHAYALPVPPPMPRREIAQPTTAPAGEQIELNDQGTKFLLFLPASYAPQSARDVPLTIHFHTAPWFAIQEHLRHGLKTPLIVWYAGEGSTKYRVPFEDRGRLRRWLDLVEAELNRRGLTPPGAHVTTIDISSFSAGYGAVREIVKSPEYLALLRRVVLCDSLYASFEAENTPHAASRPATEHIEPWLPLARAAARSEKTFVLTFSQVPTGTYASTAMCAQAIADSMNVRLSPVPRGALPATLNPQFPLLARCDIGHLHLWGYGGSDGPAHLTHARHLADVWMSLDAAGAP